MSTATPHPKQATEVFEPELLLVQVVVKVRPKMVMVNVVAACAKGQRVAAAFPVQAPHGIALAPPDHVPCSDGAAPGADRAGSSGRVAGEGEESRVQSPWLVHRRRQ